MKFTKSRYFIVEKNTDLYRDYIAYLDNKRVNKETIQKTACDWGLDAYKSCYLYNGILYCKPTKKDLKRFTKNELIRTNSGDEYYFAEGSDIGKKASTLYLKEVKEPRLVLYVDIPHTDIRAETKFLHKGDLYVFIKFEKKLVSHVKWTEGWKQINEKEFYKALYEFNRGVKSPTIFDVAKYILDIKGTTSSWVLHKLCYYSQAWCLAWTGKPMFEEEFEAWSNGPACNELYDVIKGNYYINSWDITGSSDNLSTDQKDVIITVLKDYGHMLPYELRELSRSESPWKDARGDLPDGVAGHEIIPKDAIKEYYESL